LVSFLSPCNLPIIPGFLAYMAGTSLGESKSKRKDIYYQSLGFKSI
jgi:cytochrome c biogenesis protein CcdA